MPLYYFDIRNGNGLVADEEGTELANLEEAQREAIISLANISRDHRAADAPHSMSVEVKDEHKRLVLEAILTLEVRHFSR